mmetsp:Transcript_26758/g.42920  ORF Transcript_26758/g.42920 Transcript_26758/m.42920 type:complete len:319 (-) Transcript_26758:32-988(-)
MSFLATIATTGSPSSVASGILPGFISSKLVWLTFIFPSSIIWNEIHGSHSVSDGGVWHYGPNDRYKSVGLVEFIEGRHPDYDSVWDVACNLGVVLKHLAIKHPNRRYVGSDISSVMVNATRSECLNCTVEAFDVAQLQYADHSSHGFPNEVDVIIVADVMYYISWGGWPPIGNWLYPSFMVSGYQTRFLQHLTRRARKEVIFTNHQNNKGVRRFFREMGISPVEVNSSFSQKPIYFWVVKGSAASWRETYAKSSELPEGFSLGFFLLQWGCLAGLVLILLPRRLSPAPIRWCRLLCSYSKPDSDRAQDQEGMECGKLV